ncbi:invs-b, partial [Symbiodinium microadriaticum]
MSGPNVQVTALCSLQVSICGLCGESLKVLLDSQPAAATVEDTAGRLPLHVAVDKNKPWLRLIATLVAAYPDGCKSRDGDYVALIICCVHLPYLAGGGRLPIHIAVDRNNPSIEVVRLLISTYPDGAVMRRGVGRLPIHYAVFYDHPNLEVVNFLLETYPTGAKLVDVYGRLPLHYAVDRARPNLDVVKTLLHVFPDGVFAKDTLSRSPLSIAVDHGEPMPVEVLRILVAAYPISVKEKGPMGKLPLLIAVETARPSLACVRFLAQSYPDAISCGAVDGKEDTPLSTCRARGLEYLERE